MNLVLAVRGWIGISSSGGRKLRNVSVSDSIVLVCAVFASLASGVLLAYGTCLALFGLFHLHASQSPAQPRVRVANSTSAVEG
jgi:hypothetical protein